MRKNPSGLFFVVETAVMGHVRQVTLKNRLNTIFQLYANAVSEGSGRARGLWLQRHTLKLPNPTKAESKRMGRRNPHPSILQSASRSYPPLCPLFPRGRKKSNNNQLSLETTDRLGDTHNGCGLRGG